MERFSGGEIRLWGAAGETRPSVARRTGEAPVPTEADSSLCSERQNAWPDRGQKVSSI